MKTLFKIITVLLFTYCNFSFAQDPIYYTIGENELNDVDIYSMIEASNGDLYISSDNGLYKYSNGTLFKLSKLKEQKGNSLFSLVETTSGKIYCSNLKGQVFKVHKNQLQLFYTIPKESKNYFPYLLTDTKDNLLVVSKEINIFSNTGKQIDTIKDFEFVEKNYKGQIVIGVSKTNYFFLHQKEKQYQVPASFNKKKHYYQISILRRNLEGEETKNYSFNVSDKLLMDETSNSILTYSPTTYLNKLRTYSVQEIVKKDNTFVKGDALFKNTFISCFTKGRSGVLYLGTFKQGVRVIPNYNFRTVKTAKLPRSIVGFDVRNDNEIYFHLRGKGLFHFNSDTQKTTLVEVNYLNQDVFCNQDIQFENSTIFSDVFLQSLDKNRGYGGVKDIAVVNNQAYLAATSIGVVFLGDENLFKDLKKRRVLDNSKSVFLEAVNERCVAIEYQPTTSTIYVASQNKLLSITKGKISEIKYNNQSIVANSLVLIDNALFIGSNQKGVLKYQNNKISVVYNKDNGLASNTIKKIAFKEGYLFVQNPDFFQFVNLATNKIKPLNRGEGVIGYINDFNLSDNNLWVLTDNSTIMSMPLLQLKSLNTQLKFEVDSLKINNELINTNANNSFSYNNNNVNFFFHLKNDTYRKQTQIKYQLKGFDDTYNNLPANTKNKEFKKLPFGKYTFKAFAQYGTVKSNEFTYNFTIKPPFWRTWWFELLSILAFLLVVLLYFKYSITQEKKKTEEKLKQQQVQTDLIQAKLTALRSQMNPHFIFNALNSIQNLILKKDSEASYDYVVLFSKLVRNTLNYSEQEFIPLEEEVDFLDIYLQLEQLRFGEEFSYSITNNCDELVEVPSLLVQPFVENALLHGLLSKIGNKEVTICFTMKESQLICTVIDNGIGRKKSAEIQKRQGKSNKSFALTAIQKRLNFLKKQYGESIGYTFVDVFENEKNTGTKVVIILPYKH